MVVDILLDYLKRPGIQLKAFVEFLCGEEILYDDVIFKSELDSAYINRALVNYMKGHGNIKNSVEAVIDTYLYQCAMNMNCITLANAFLFLANSGIVPGSNEKILNSSQTKHLNAILLTCGVYDQAGEFACLVGLPAKKAEWGVGLLQLFPNNWLLLFGARR